MGIEAGGGIYGGRAPEIGPVTKQRNRPPRAGWVRSENSERGRWLQRGVSPRSAGGRHVTRSGLYGCSIAPHSLWKQADDEGRQPSHGRPQSSASTRPASPGWTRAWRLTTALFVRDGSSPTRTIAGSRPAAGRAPPNEVTMPPHPAAQIVTRRRGRDRMVTEPIPRGAAEPRGGNPSGR